LVNHCVNDIAVLGAEPLFFLDYIGTGRLQPRVFEQLIARVCPACGKIIARSSAAKRRRCPAFTRKGEYDLSGTIVGVVEKSRILDGKGIRPGDAIIGLASSGLHTNGYSLARKIFFEQMKLRPPELLAELDGSIGDELLKVHQLRPA
jgi:phosphoribosylformylglycinamidine cyclo-ligase